MGPRTGSASLRNVVAGDAPLPFAARLTLSSTNPGPRAESPLKSSRLFYHHDWLF
jgi:hypothetical protein